jgi:hypothetical protein
MQRFTLRNIQRILKYNNNANLVSFNVICLFSRAVCRDETNIPQEILFDYGKRASPLVTNNTSAKRTGLAAM